jgi:hypothetical protein
VLAPASLVGCLPLINGEVAFAGNPPAATTLEYVTMQAGDENTFVANTFGVTTRESWGVTMNGGGVAGARPVYMSDAAMATMDMTRRTIAWAQRFLGPSGSTQTSVFYNGTAGVNQVYIAAPRWYTEDPTIHADIGADPTPFTATAPETLISEWHSIMISWSDGTGVDPAVGMAMWFDGVLLASRSTFTGNGPGPAPDNIFMGGFPNALEADLEYFYEFNEYIPSGNDLAHKLWVNPYYFFGRRGGPRAWAYCDDAMLMGAA